MIKSLDIYPHQELVKACRRNDKKAQVGLYRNYYKAMYHTAYRIVNNAIESEDIMQEAFIDAFQKIGQLGESMSFGAWLKRIVINKSLDFIKKEKVRQAYKEQVVTTQNEIENEEEPELKYSMKDIHESMKMLPDQYRVVLSLHLFEGMDHDEMAQILDLSYSNTKTRYARARKRLCDELVKLSKNKGEKEMRHVES